MTVFIIGVSHLRRLDLLEVSDDEVLAKEVGVAVGAIARRAMHEGDRDEEDERKLDLHGSSVRDLLSLNSYSGYWIWSH